MANSPNTLTKLILDSKALSIWNRKTGPVFWWTSGLPAPFYLRTEVMIGRDLADDLLEKITATVAANPDRKACAAELKVMMLDAYKKHPDYQTVIKAMVAHAKNEFALGSYTAVSGGERRDWFFSIPFAEEIGLKHIYLFKDQSLYCAESLTKREKVLHVSDIISKAASYFNQWLPALKQHDLVCAGTVSVNAHGTKGVARLEEAGCKVAPVKCIELSFFLHCFDAGLISSEASEESKTYFASEKEWADKYVMENPALLTVPADKKTIERMNSFFTQDPLGLRATHAAFFEKMMAAIKAPPSGEN